MNRRLTYCSALLLALAVATEGSAAVYAPAAGVALRDFASRVPPYLSIAERPVEEPNAVPAEPPPDTPPNQVLPPAVILDGRPVPFPLDTRRPGPTEEPPVDVPDLVQAEPQTEPPDPPPDEP